MLSPGDSVISRSDLQIGSSLTKDYREVLKTWEVNELVTENRSLGYTIGQLQPMLAATNPTDARIIKISLNSSKPREAMGIANEYAKVAQECVAIVMGAEKPSVLSSAKLPGAPYQPAQRATAYLAS